MDQSCITQNRRSRRSNVLLSATLDASGTVHPVKLRNLSTEGALVEGEKLPIEGSQVLFRRNDLEVESRIAWVSGRHAGVAFGAPLKAEDVLRNVPKPRPRMRTEFKRPGLSSRELTPEEKRLLDSWVWAPTLERP